MTDKQTAALKLALEALEEACEIVGPAWAWRDEKGTPAIAAIREAWAEQPAQEPVAYSYTSRITGAQGVSHHPMPRFIDSESWDIKPLYTSPQPAQQKGCQCPSCKVTPHASDCAVHNAPAYPIGECNCEAQPEQKPVAWRNAALRVGEDLCSVGPFGYYDMTAEQWLDWALSVVTVHAPPASKPWVGLTDEEKSDLWCKSTGRDCVNEDTHVFADSIEAKLRKKNQ